jgi:hypothetical protein
MEKTLWAVKIGDEDWKEQVITSTKDKQHLSNAMKWAVANGFDRLRTTDFKMEKPNFEKAVNV